MMENTETAGGSRYSTGKVPQIYAPWGGMEEVCRVSAMGAEKYAPYDYLNGQSFSTLLNSAMRHLRKAVRSPLERDPESGCLHLGHAAWNLLCLLDFIEQGRAWELDDVTPWHGITAAQRREIEAAAERSGVSVLDILRNMFPPEDP